VHYQNQLGLNALGSGGWVRCLAAGVFYLGTAVAINFLQMLSLVIAPFSRSYFRAINRWFGNLWWSWCVIGAEQVYGVKPVFTGDEVPPDENALIFANHQQMPDILAIMMIAYRKKRLGDMKWFVKDPIKYVPGIGWGLQFLDCIFVKRDWLADKKRILGTFSKFLNYRISIWLITFVEGTRFTTEKVARSQMQCRRKGLPDLEYVLIPRTRGFVAALEGLEGHLQAVYDVTIGYEEGLPRLHHLFRSQVKRIHIDVRRFPIADLPASDEGRTQWLKDRFVRKDALMKAFFASSPMGFEKGN
jgi:1-acyl-sn-glycerol-3-phosphate acyltransferase